MAIKVCTIVGVRPQFIKLSILMRKLKSNPEFDQVVINTGQHYDYQMAQQFFRYLKIPDPNYNLEINNENSTQRSTKMFTEIESILLREKPELTIVVGDAYCTFAGTLASLKARIPVAHVEAGVRSFNWRMPEEIIRMFVDHHSEILFVPTKIAEKNLLSEGIRSEKIFLTGDITVDVFNENLNEARNSRIMSKLNLNKKDFMLMTLHRTENVDDKESLYNILSAVSNFKNVVFPLHPGTKKNMEKFGFNDLIKNMIVTEPLSYFDFLNLIENASLIVTDSGGVQKEAFLAKTPCITVRNESEWVETIESGANILAGTDTRKIIESIKDGIKRKIDWQKNPFGDGNASDKMIETIKNSVRFKKIFS